MAKQTFAVTQAGLAVPAWIGLSGQTTSLLHTTGQPILPPVQAQALLDTGTNVTAVSSWILRQLRIPVATTTSTHTVTGSVRVNLYEVSLSLASANQPGTIWFTEPDLLVMELATVLPDADVLVGLDLLLKCKLALDGPSRQFTLEA